MTAPVVIISAPGRTPLQLIVTEPFEVGRACPGVLVDDPAVSRRHLEIQPSEDGASVVVRDLGSANGTTVDGRPLIGATTLAADEVVALGDVTLRLAASAAPGLGASSPGSDEPMTSIERVADVVLHAPAPTDPVSIAHDSAAGHQGLTRTIVFSDIENSTDHAVALGDVAWFELLEVHNGILRSCLGRHDGHEVKSQGDGFMLTFPSARRAVAYMIEMQQALAADIDMQRHGLRVRIGAHTGEAVEADDGDLFGQAVIAAARVGAEANGGEILVSSLVREIVESWGEVRFGTTRVVPLKGLAKEWAVHPVEWGVDA